MRRLLLVSAAVLGLSGCALGRGGGAAGVAPQFIGTWTGTGTQSYQPGVEWTIEATIAGGAAEQVGTIHYPSVECGGVLLLRSAGANWLEVREDITYGDCVDQGILTLTPMADGQLRYEWRVEDGDLTARGTLTRAR